jgi:diketogulonate reductase-like aldo/keto reductase
MNRMNLTINSKLKLNNGVKIPLFGLGTWDLRGEVGLIIVKWALKTGYKLIDTATYYENEKIIGEAINQSKTPREDVFITSKVWIDDLGYKRTLDAFNKSLKALNTSYIDLYLIHWPIKEKRKQSWKAMEQLYKEGKIRAIGVSNFAIHHIEEFLTEFDVVPAVNQVEFNAFLYQKELLEYCKSKDIKLEAYRPITGGRKLDSRKLIKISEKYNKSTAQILIRWLLQQEIITIPRTSKRERIDENANVFDFNISEEDMNNITSLNESFRTTWNTNTWD